MSIRLFEVGGCVRDELMGLQSKDVDFAVEAPSFEAMEEHIKDMGLRVFLSTPEFLTVRAGVPKDHDLRERCDVADFVLCRKDGPPKDGRRPEFVEPGTIFDDLARRDFTINAIARDPFSGGLIDPHDGQADLEERLLRFVGEPMERIREDGLRVLRGIRFSITKELYFDEDTWKALSSFEAAKMLKSVSVERIHDEVNKMLEHDVKGTLQTFDNLPPQHWDACFRDGLRLTVTLKKLKKKG